MGILDHLKKLRKTGTPTPLAEENLQMGDMAQIDIEDAGAQPAPESPDAGPADKPAGPNSIRAAREKFARLRKAAVKPEKPSKPRKSRKAGSGGEGEDNGFLKLISKDSGVVSIKGHDFAANLIWVSDIEEGSAKDYVALAQKISAGRARLDNDFEFCSSRKAQPYYGFGSRDSGHLRGMPILIESLSAEILGANWLLVCEVEGRGDTWWVAARRDGKVFEDRIFEGKSQAAEAFSDAQSAPDWNTLIAPEDWFIPDSLPGIPSSALLKPKERTKLQLVDPLRTYAPRLILAGAILSATAGGGWYFYDRHQKYLADMEETRQRVERAIMLEPEDFPWYHRTSLPEFLEACEREIAATTVFVTGWENQQFTCRIDRGRGTVSTGWNRAGGDISWLRASMPRDFPDISVHNSIESATVSRSFTAPRDTTALRTEPWTRNIIERRLAERFQVLGITSNLRYVADNRPADTNALFHRHELQLQGSMGLGSLIPMISDIPALIPDTLNINLATDGWSLILRIHHPVVLPEFAQ